MIVYGDPSFRASACELAARLHERCVRCVSERRDGAAQLDELRRIVVWAGQFEQAMADEVEREASSPRMEREAQLAVEATDAAARAFVGAVGDAGGESVSVIERSLARAAGLLGSFGYERELRVKVPEGFAFYGLLPEQYAEAARLWMRETDAAVGAEVLVVGLRSIGTSLSAVVGAALAARGWAVRRCTVRPQGHPYERRVLLPEGVARGAEHAIVVDEGPGASGSSMAAAAVALVGAGIPESRVSFMPGHPGEPGPKASGEVRGTWKRVRRYVCLPERAVTVGGTLLGRLASETVRLCGASGTVHVEDVGGGKWRGIGGAAEHEWPAAMMLFERPKFLVWVDGMPRVLWRFAGYALDGGEGDPAEREARRWCRLAGLGWTVPAVGRVSGFVGVPWVEGARLTADAADDGVLRQVGRYIAEAAGPEMDAGACAEAVRRLREMVEWNVKLGLGEDAGRKAGERMEQAERVIGGRAWASAGDGRLGPCEWIRSSGGELVKVDCGGHDRDHTIVGRQPLVWDVAGALVEWRLKGNRARVVTTEALGSGSVALGVLEGMRIAYAALRMGQCRVCGEAAGDAREQERLRAAEAAYRREISRRLSTPSP